MVSYHAAPVAIWLEVSLPSEPMTQTTGDDSGGSMLRPAVVLRADDDDVRGGRVVRGGGGVSRVVHGEGTLNSIGSYVN